MRREITLLRQVPALPVNAALRRLAQTGDYLEQCALTAAGWSQYRREVSLGGKRHIEFTEQSRCIRPITELEGNVVKFQHGAGGWAPRVGLSAAKINGSKLPSSRGL